MYLVKIERASWTSGRRISRDICEHVYATRQEAIREAGRHVEAALMHMLPEAGACTVPCTVLAVVSESDRGEVIDILPETVSDAVVLSD